MKSVRRFLMVSLLLTIVIALTHSLSLAQPPTVTSVTPSSGTQSSVMHVSIRGADFVTTSNNTVDFGPGITIDTVRTISTTELFVQIRISLTAALGPRDVRVTNYRGTGTGRGLFRVLVLPSPRITSVTPASGPQGSSLDVIINGENLSLATAVDFGAGIRVDRFQVFLQPSKVHAIKATITILATAAIEPRNVIVRRHHVYGVGIGLFRVTAATTLPTVLTADPSSAMQGARLDITIRGRNFTGTTAVGFGAGITVNSFLINNSMQITANITINPSAATGLRDITVRTPTGTATGRGLFTVKLYLI